jgi:glutaredoxin-like protein
MDPKLSEAPSAAPAEASEAAAADERLIVYGTSWCGDCRRTRRFLDGHQVPYQWVDVDQDPVAAALVRQINRGRRSVPTLVFADGSTLTEPSDPELARKLAIG